MDDLVSRNKVLEAVRSGTTHDDIRARIEIMEPVPAIPISVIEQIKAEIKNYLEDEKCSENGVSDVGIGLELSLNIINKVVKECEA